MSEDFSGPRSEDTADNGDGTGTDCPPKVGGSTEFTSQDQLMNIKIHHHPGSESNKNFLDFQITFQQSGGWFAIGVSETSGSMTGGMSGGSDIIACEQDAGAMRYWATSRTTSWVNQGMKLKKTLASRIERRMTQNSQIFHTANTERKR